MVKRASNLKQDLLAALNTDMNRFWVSVRTALAVFASVVPSVNIEIIMW